MKNLEQLIEHFQSDEQLCAKVAAVGDDEAAANAILAEEGYDATVAELREYAEQKLKDSPSEEELRKVAGGTSSSVEDVSCVMSAVVGFGSSCWIPY